MDEAKVKSEVDGPPVDFVTPRHPSLEMEEDRQSPSLSSSSSSNDDDDSSSSSSDSNSSSSSSSGSTSSNSTSTESETRSKISEVQSGPGDDDLDSHAHNQGGRSSKRAIPTVQPYVAKMERIELFSTAQCYYLISSDKASTTFRVIKMDRTLIEFPASKKNGMNNNIQDGRFSDKGANQNVDNANAVEKNNAVSDIVGMIDQGGGSRKLRSLPEFCTEDPNIYSKNEIRNMLEMIRDGDQSQSTAIYPDDVHQPHHSKANGGLQPLVQAHGIVGFIRFLDCYYLTLITKKSKVGSIGGNIIYTIKDTETIPIKPADAMGSQASVLDDAAGNDPHSMLLNMWNRGKRSLNLGLTPRELAELRYQGLYQVVDLTKDFFFSYTYDLTQSLQQNMLNMTSRIYPPPPFKSMYMWNYFQTREIEEVTGNMTSFHWIMPIIHGAFIQRKLQDYGRSLNLLLLARRSRHFAGTRYLKRGVSDQGKVGNDVEHEQIIHDESTIGEGVFSSFLQVRGSIPTFWTQESSVTMPKPPIVLNRVDPTYQATQLHFEDLFRRYSSPILVVDLVKQSEKREREVIVGNEFRHAIDYLNHQIDDEHKIRYCALDYSHISKHRNLNVSSSLHDVSTWAVNQTGFFCSSPRWKIVENSSIVPFDESIHITHHNGVPIFPMEQKGVLRTNCIDCLDRTNVAQFSAGVEALGQELVVMGIRSSATLSPSSSIVKLLIDMYVEIGDHLALQYGGSEAHKKVQVQNTGSDAKGDATMGKHKELLTSIRRYYSNAFTDRLKQDAMNLFLGHYIPKRHLVPLWDLESDYYLHNYHCKSGTASMKSMELCQYMAAASLEDEDMRGNRNINTTPILQRPKHISNSSRKYSSPSKDFDSGIIQDSWRVERVVKRCSAQNVALTSWWRGAIQTYIDQRCWMHLGNNPFESMIPSRFERTYGAHDELANFDHFFQRPFTRPLHASHSSQKRKADDEEKESLLLYRKTLSPHNDGSSIEISSNFGDSDEEDKVTLKDLTQKFGYRNRRKPYLGHFLKKEALLASSFKNHDGDSSIAFGQYSKYVEPNNQPPITKSRRESTYEEFSKYLNDVSIKSDDVSSVLNLSQGAHVNSEILTGPYRGLSQHESAIEVTTVINEQYNALENMKRNGSLKSNNGVPRVDEELKRREMDTPGVMDAVYGGWKQFGESNECYREILSSDSMFHRRSDLTDERSMKLYCSFFNQDTKVTDLDVARITGHSSFNKNAKHTSQFEEKPKVSVSRFANKAMALGIKIQQNEETKKDHPALFPLDEVNNIPPGFEQINDDLFARKDNRFMVFNRVGIDEWPPRSKTKVGGIEDDMTMLQSTVM